MPAARRASVRSGADAARGRTRAAMTLVEVMIALTVLVLGLMAVLSHYVTLYDMRQRTQHLAQVQEVVRALNERFEAADVWGIGKVVVVPSPPAPTAQYLLPWSLPRFEGGYTVSIAGVATVVDFPPMTEKDLLDPTIAILQRPIDMPDLKVYCEYYRYEHDDNGTPTTTADDRPGLLDLLTNPDTASAGDLQAAFIRHLTDTVPQCSIDPRIPPVTDVADHKSVAIRIIATWGPNNAQRYELFTAKRRIPQQQ